MPDADNSAACNAADVEASAAAASAASAAECESPNNQHHDQHWSNSNWCCLSVCWWYRLFCCSPLYTRYTNMLRTKLVVVFLVLQVAFNVWAAVGELEASEASEYHFLLLNPNI